MSLTDVVPTVLTGPIGKFLYSGWPATDGCSAYSIITSRENCLTPIDRQLPTRQSSQRGNCTLAHNPESRVLHYSRRVNLSKQFVLFIVSPYITYQDTRFRKAISADLNENGWHRHHRRHSTFDVHTTTSTATCCSIVRLVAKNWTSFIWSILSKGHKNSFDFVATRINPIARTRRVCALELTTFCTWSATVSLYNQLLRASCFLMNF